MFSFVYHGKLCLWKILNRTSPALSSRLSCSKLRKLPCEGQHSKCCSDVSSSWSCSWMRLNLWSWIKHRIDGCQVISLRQVPLAWLLVVQQLTSTRLCVEATILQLSQRLTVVTLTVLWLDLGVFLCLLPAFYGANDSVSWHSLSKSMVS